MAAASSSASGSARDGQLNQEPSEYTIMLANLQRGKVVDALNLLHSIECYVTAVLHSKPSSNKAEMAAKQRVLDDAVKWGKQLVITLPKSVHFAHFYANLLHGIAKEPIDHLRAIRECVRGLKIDDPIEQDIDDKTFPKFQLLLKKSKAAFKFNEYDEKLQSIVELLKKNNLGVAADSLSQLKSGGSVVPKLIPIDGKLVEARDEGDFDDVLEYCNGMTAVELLELLEIGISALQEHSKGEEHSKGGEILSQAIDFAQKMRTWKYYACCICGQAFADKKSLLRHIRDKYTDLKQIVSRKEMPSKVTSKWEEMLLNCPWTPVDIDDNMDIIKVNDFEREEILEKIGELFKQLVEGELLDMGHFQKLLDITVKELPGVIAEEWHHMIDSLAKNPLCFRLLRTPQLNTVLNFLQEIWDFSCSINIKPKVFLQNYRHPLDNVHRKESVVFSENLSSLVMDKTVLKLDLWSDDDLSAAHAVPDRAKFVNWLTTRYKSDELSEAWKCSREIQTSKGVALFLAIESEITCLNYLCMIKQACSNRQKLIETIKETWAKEVTKRVDCKVYAPQKLSDLLLKLAKEQFIKATAAKDDNDDPAIMRFTANEVVSKAITSIIEEGQNRFNKNKKLKEECCYLTAFGNMYKNQPFIELTKIDTMIMRSLDDIRQLEHAMAAASTFDFRVIIVSFMKSFMWRELQLLVEVLFDKKKVFEIKDKLKNDKKKKHDLEDMLKQSELELEEIKKKRRNEAGTSTS